MLGNKSFSANAYETINIAYQNCKSHKRSLSSIDILVAILNEPTNLAGRVLRDYNVAHSSVNATYQNISSQHKENFSLEAFCNFANAIAEGSEDNAISAEHMLLAIIGSPMCFAFYSLHQHNANVVDIDCSLADAMGRPGFIFSYLLTKQDFWSRHFQRWTRIIPTFHTRTWVNKNDTKIEASFFSMTKDGECGLAIKESKGGEFIFNATSEPQGKILAVTGSRRHVQVIQTCFICFALGRLAFEQDKS